MCSDQIQNAQERSSGRRAGPVLPPDTCARPAFVDAHLLQSGREFGAARRRFLKGALAGGLTLAATPLLVAESRADFLKPGVNDQKKAGEEAAQQVLRKYRVVRDNRARTFEGIGNRLVDKLSSRERGPWDYRFTLIQSDELNAFALPGGPIFLFTGLLDKMGSHDEIAAVTGHEMTHIRKEHWANAVKKQTERELGLQVLLGVTHAGGAWRQVAGGIDALLTLSYSRKEEDEADAGGLDDMVAAGYDPRGMLDLFATLQRASGKRGEAPVFLSDHPLTKDRIRHTQDRIDRLSGDRPVRKR